MLNTSIGVKSKRIGFVACSVVMLATNTNAETPSTHWQAALNSGSQRLALFALQSEKPLGADGLVLQLQYDLAMRQGPLAGPKMLSYDASLKPIASYDNNINGGVPKGFFYIGGSRFDLPADTKAKSGIVLGAEVKLSTRLALSRGLTFDLSAMASQAHSIDYGLDKLQAETSACLAQFLGKSGWADFCFGNTFDQNAKSISKEQFLSFGGSKVFASSFGFHEVSATLKQTWSEDFDRAQSSVENYKKSSLALKILTANSGFGAVGLDLNVGEFVRGQNSPLFGAGISLTRPIGGEVTTLFASYGREGGASFLGKDRHDQIYSIGVNRNITRHANVSLRLSQRNSDASLFDGVQTVDFDVNLIGF